MPMLFLYALLALKAGAVHITDSVSRQHAPGIGEISGLTDPNRPSDTKWSHPPATTGEVGDHTQHHPPCVDALVLHTMSEAKEEPAVQTQHEDKPERSFSFLSCLGLAFTTLNSWCGASLPHDSLLTAAVAASLPLVLPSGGSVSMVWGLVVSTVGTMAMALSLAEICHAFPTSGGQYDWACGSPLSFHLSCLLTSLAPADPRHPRARRPSPAPVLPHGLERDRGLGSSRRYGRDCGRTLRPWHRRVVARYCAARVAGVPYHARVRAPRRNAKPLWLAAVAAHQSRERCVEHSRHRRRRRDGAGM